MTSPSRPWTQTKTIRALQLREAGSTYRSIATALRVPESAVRYHIKPGERERRLRNAQARYARMAAALGPVAPRQPLPPARGVWFRLRGAPLARLEQLAAWRGLGIHAAARELLIEALDRDDQAEFT